MTDSDLRELLEGNPLTDREVAVLRGAAKGETCAQSAEHLHYAMETVREIRKMAIAKLGARNIAHAVAIAIVYGIVNPDHVVKEEE